jgi:hypothetical protein
VRADPPGGSPGTGGEGGDYVKRHVTKFAALTTMVSLGLMAAYVLAGPVAAQGQGTCIEGGTKIENPGDSEVITADSPITQVAIKAGNDCFFVGDADFPSDCYSVSGIGTNTVTITRIGSGRDCKEISHIEYTTGPVEPPPTTTVPTSSIPTTT